MTWQRVHKKRCLTWLTALAAGLGLAGASLAAPAAPPPRPTPYPLYPELYVQAKAVLTGSADPRASANNLNALAKKIDDELALAVLPAVKNRDNKLNQLLCLHDLAAMAARTTHQKMLLFLLDNPLYLSRFEHATTGSKKIEAALGVLQTLRDYDPDKFKEHREFCLAFAAVWNDFHGYYWVEKKCGPVKPDAMLDLYKYFVKHEDQMIIRPWTLPFELSVFVVHSSVTPEERLWVLQNYGGNLSAGKVYMGVPWTNVLSPAWGKGDGIDYTLMNIKKMGGVCMEQAYFTEQVFRLHGVPASFMHGGGKRGSHAWAGVFLLGPTPHWDFTAGRYRYDHYYAGSTFDPTNCGNSAAPLSEAQIKLTAAGFAQGSAALDNIEKSYCYCAAAEWAKRSWPEKPADAAAPGRDQLVLDLIGEALKANPDSDRVWSLAAAQAKAGKLTPDQALDWAKKLADTTLDSFPEYTVNGLGAFLDCSDKPDLKLELYAKLYGLLSKKRPDLACNIKVAEGDIWLAKDDFKKALQCYVFPMVNFSKDDQILSVAKKKLEDLGAKGQGEKAAQACRDVLKILEEGQSTPERKEAAEIIRKKLEKLEQVSSSQPAESHPATSGNPATNGN